MNITSLGLIAGALTSFAGVPQLLRVYRTKQVRDLSVWQPVLLSIGVFLWLVYGVVIGDLPLITADLFSLICCLLLLGMMYLYRRNQAAGGKNRLLCDKLTKEEL